MNVDMGECLKFGWERTMKNPAFYIVGWLLVGLVGGFTGGICYGPMLVGYFRGCAKEDQGGKAEIGDVFSGMSDFLPGFLAFFVGALVAMLGLCACCIGIMFTQSIPVVGTYYVALGEKDGFNAFKKSLAIFQSNMMGIGLASAVIGLVMGFVLTGPIGLAAFYRLSQQAAGGAGPASPPPFAPPGGMPGAPR